MLGRSVGLSEQQLPHITNRIIATFLTDVDDYILEAHGEADPFRRRTWSFRRA